MWWVRGLTGQEHDDVGRLVRRRRTYQPRERRSSHGHHERLEIVSVYVVVRCDIPEHTEKKARGRERHSLQLFFCDFFIPS